MAVTVRRVTADDFEVVKQLRLESLERAPGAFLSTLAEERAMPEERWQERLDSNVAGVRTAGFLAVVDGEAQGLVVGVRPEGRPDVVDLNAMWIAPAARRRGAGRALVEAVCDWARELGCARVTLCVIEGNPGAEALYRACGFTEVSRCAPDDDPRRQIRMERPVRP